MNFVQQLALYISITAFIFLLLGLYKPWAMLWWEDVQNRRKVIRLSGSIASVAYLTHWIIVLLI